MYSKELDKVLRDTWLLAKTDHHAFVSIEHLLHAIALDETGNRILYASGVDIALLQEDIQSFYQQIEKNEHSEDPIHTIAFKRVIHHCLMHAHAAEQKEVGIGDVLISMFTEEESHAVYFLRKQGVERLDVMNFVAHGIRKSVDDIVDDDLDDSIWDELEDEMDTFRAEDLEDDVNPDDDTEASDGFNDRAGAKNRKKKRSALALYTEDWTQQARDGEFDKLIGRNTEVQRTIEVLCRRTKNNPIYVGDPGVGKTAIAQGLAQRLATDDVPERLHGFRLLSLDLGNLIAGTRFRGDFEERLKKVLRELAEEEKVVLFIDEIHNLIGAGAAGNSTMDASNLLKPALQSGKIRCVGATTFEEYKNHFEKDRALSRRFQKVDVHEPGIDDAIRILTGLQPEFERYHGLKYQPSAVEGAVHLSARYLNDRQLPDKAIDILDEVGARVSLKPTARKQVTLRDVEELVSTIARVPIQSLSTGDKESLRTIAHELSEAVYGQDQAIQAVVNAVKRHRAGLGNAQKPIGSYLFSGPTGVGKTELCRVVAQKLGIELIRFDMSEYMEKHTISRLIGAPAGYVGFEQGGLLTDAIRRNPNAVLLLDEIEKAHQDVYNVLLQIMDYATLTDNTGRKADFRNVLLIMTSNVGSREISRTGIGFLDGDSSVSGGDPHAAIRQHFTPEFRNRLDDIIIFKHLNESVILRIVDKFMSELNTQLADKKVVITVSDEAKSWLAAKGYSPAYGARPMSRIIQEHVKNPLVDEILFGSLQKGGNIRVELNENTLVFVNPGKSSDIDINVNTNG
jgi:ATP-dependent Clp protease ATP-binding subunit ClpA